MKLPGWLGEKRETLLTLAVVLFVLTWPLEKRHLVYTEYSFVTGAFTEAGTMALYASDVAFTLLGLAWVWWKRTARASPGEPAPVSRAVFWAGVAFVAWAALRALSLSPSLLGWYAAARVAQGFLLMIITAGLWRIPRVRVVALGSLVVAGVLQSLLGLSQVSRSSDLGLRFLGEHPLSLSTPGVAKVDIVTRNSKSVNVPVETKVLRAYGTFPHPNVLGWFLVASSGAGLALLLVPSVSAGLSPDGRKPRETWAETARGSPGFPAMFLAEHAVVATAVVSVLTFGTLVTFSRASWIAFALLGAGWLLRSSKVNKAAKIVLLGGVTLGLAVPTLLSSDIRQAVVSRVRPPEADMFLRERSISYLDSIHATSQNVLFGVGTGAGIPYLSRNKRNIDLQINMFSSDKADVSAGTIMEPWRIQYPHNVPLVVLLELGTVGFSLFLWFLYLLFKFFIVKYHFSHFSKHSAGSLLVLAAFLIPVLVDHFPWTIQQGRVLLWALLGVTAASVRMNTED